MLVMGLEQSRKWWRSRRSLQKQPLSSIVAKAILLKFKSYSVKVEGFVPGDRLDHLKVEVLRRYLRSVWKLEWMCWVDQQRELRSTMDREVLTFPVPCLRWECSYWWSTLVCALSIKNSVPGGSTSPWVWTIPKGISDFFLQDRIPVTRSRVLLSERSGIFALLRGQ